MVKSERQRYIKFKLIRRPNCRFNEKDFLRAVWGSIWRYFGMKEANKVGLWLISLDFKDNVGILRCSHPTKEIVISSLSLIKQINRCDVIISPMKTSGTIKALKNEEKARNNN